MIGNPFLRKLLWAMAAVGIIIFAGEGLLILIEEGVDIVVEASQALFMMILERGFGLPYEKAQGLAAWASLGLLALIVGLAGWRLAPLAKRKLAETRRQYRETLYRLRTRWRSAKWYQKLLAVSVGATLLLGLMMVV